MQHEIKCPNCGKVFTIDETSYAEIQKQVRNAEFETELEKRLHLEHESNEKDIKNAKLDAMNFYNGKLSEKDREIEKLKGDLAKFDAEKSLAISEATKQIEKENEKLKSDFILENEKHKNELTTLKSSYETQLKAANEQTEFYKDFKARQSTKGIGESLEQHCNDEFLKIRALAFPRAVFGKDNTVSKESGSKGDFIFRDFDEAGNEIISIMFEMKNENDTTATKHKNENFFKELDKDRKEKKCEYAVLVSMLEADSELYNTGIVDVSFAYEKMYVIRPQFFIPLISILRNSALNAQEYKAELAEIKNQNIDITDFESRIERWKESFALNSDRAAKNFGKAIEDINKSIDYLTKTKEALLLTIKNFDTANNKLDDLTVKKLTRGNETMTKMFADLDENN